MEDSPTPAGGLLRLLPQYVRQFLEGSHSQGHKKDPLKEENNHMSSSPDKLHPVVSPPTIDINPNKLSQGEEFFNQTIDDILTDERNFDMSFDEYSGFGEHSGVDEKMSTHKSHESDSDKEGDSSSVEVVKGGSLASEADLKEEVLSEPVVKNESLGSEAVEESEEDDVTRYTSLGSETDEQSEEDDGLPPMPTENRDYESAEYMESEEGNALPPMPTEDVDSEFDEVGENEEDDGLPPVLSEDMDSESEEDEGPPGLVVQDGLPDPGADTDESLASEVDEDEQSPRPSADVQSHGTDVDEDEESSDIAADIQSEVSEAEESDIEDRTTKVEHNEEPVEMTVEVACRDLEVDEDEDSSEPAADIQSHNSETDEDEESVELGLETSSHISEVDESDEDSSPREESRFFASPSRKEQARPEHRQTSLPLHECEDPCPELTEKDEEDIIFRSVDERTKDDILLFITGHQFINQFPVRQIARRQYVKDIQTKAASAGMDALSIDFLVKYVRRTYMEIHDIYCSDIEGSTFGDEIDEPDERVKPSTKSKKQRKRKRESAEGPEHIENHKRRPRRSPSVDEDLTAGHDDTEVMDVSHSASSVLEEKSPKAVCVQQESSQQAMMCDTADEEKQEKVQDKPSADHGSSQIAQATNLNQKYVGAYTDDESPQSSNVQHRQKGRRKLKNKRKKDKDKQKAALPPVEQIVHRDERVDRDEADISTTFPAEESAREKRKKGEKEKRSHSPREQTPEIEQRDQPDNQVRESPIEVEAKDSLINDGQLERQASSDKKNDLENMSNDSFWNLDF